MIIHRLYDLIYTIFFNSYVICLNNSFRSETLFFYKNFVKLYIYNICTMYM